MGWRREDERNEILKGFRVQSLLISYTSNEFRSSLRSVPMVAQVFKPEDPPFSALGAV